MASTSIGRASALIAAGTLTSRLLGLVRAMVLVYAIGSTGLAANAFATASRVPNTVYTLIATGALTAVLVPQITKAALAKDRGVRYINKLVTITIVGSLAITVLVGLATPSVIGILGADWGPAQTRLATVFAVWLLPQIMFYSLYTMLGEVLNAKSVFGPYAWSPVLNNIITIAGLLIFVLMFGADPDGVATLGKWNVSAIALVAGTATLGIASQALVLFAFWRRAGLTFRLDFQWRGIGLGTMGKVAMWMFFTVLLNQLIGLINARVINIAGPNDAGLAAADLAGWIFVLPHSVVTISLVTANFTRMSESVHANNIGQMKTYLASGARIANLAMVFFTSAMIVLAYPISRFIQPNASFHTVEIVAIVLIANLISLVPFSLLFVLNRGFFSLSDTRTPFFIVVGQSVLVIAASIWCATLPGHLITAALTLAVSIILIGTAAVTFVVLRRKIGPFEGKRIAVGLAQNIAAALVAAAAGWGALVVLGRAGIGSFPHYSFFEALIACAVTVIVMGLMYLVALVLLRNREITPLVRRVLPKRGS